jgi:dTDP-4-amino-4,6-dideoxygalactose transaminase
LNKSTTAQGAHVVTALFEDELCRYTCASYAVAVDSCTSALALCLMRENVRGMEISIPERTFMSVPCQIIIAGAKVKWLPVDGDSISGAYQLLPTRIYDSALRFTADMYVPNSLMCVSFTGPNKILKLGRGGAILCDNKADYEWFKKVRNSGRSECSYHDDNFTMIGMGVYMNPQIAALGLLLIGQLYDLDGNKKENLDLCLPYPKLSRFACYQKPIEP